MLQLEVIWTLIWVYLNFYKLLVLLYGLDFVSGLCFPWHDVFFSPCTRWWHMGWSWSNHRIKWENEQQVPLEIIINKRSILIFWSIKVFHLCQVFCIFQKWILGVQSRHVNTTISLWGRTSFLFVFSLKQLYVWLIAKSRDVTWQSFQTINIAKIPSM